MLGGNLDKKCILLEQGLLSNYLYQNLNCCQDLDNKYVDMKQIKMLCQ